MSRRWERTEVTSVGGARVGFAYEVRREGAEGPLATGTTEHATVDPSGRPRRIPEVLLRCDAGPVQAMISAARSQR